MALTRLNNFANTFSRDISPLRIMPVETVRIGFRLLKFPALPLKLRQDNPSKRHKLRFPKSEHKFLRHKWGEASDFSKEK